MLNVAVFLILLSVVFSTFKHPEDALAKIALENSPKDELEGTVGDEILPEALLAQVKELLDGAEEAEYHRKDKSSLNVVAEMKRREDKTSADETKKSGLKPGAKSKCPPGQTMRDGECISGKHSHLKCSEGEALVCDKENPRKCQCKKTSKAEVKSKCPPGHTMRDGKCINGKHSHLKCGKGENPVCDKKNPRKCRCEKTSSASTDETGPSPKQMQVEMCPQGQTFRHGKCVPAKVSHLHPCPSGKTIMCQHNNPRRCHCVDNPDRTQKKCSSGKKLMCEGDTCICVQEEFQTKCGAGTKKICGPGDGTERNCVCEIVDTEPTKPPKSASQKMAIQLPKPRVLPLPPPPIWSLFHQLHNHFPPADWAMPQNLQCRKRICKAMHLPMGMAVRCKCKLTRKAEPLTCKRQYKKVCKGGKCGCFHKCNLRKLMQKCDCDAEGKQVELADPENSLEQFCDSARQDFCSRQCRPCSDLECQYANSPITKGNSGVYIAAKLRQDFCRKKGCSKEDEQAEAEENANDGDIEI